MGRSAHQSGAGIPLDEGVVLAWIEGELPEPEASAVARAVALDPALSAWAAAVRRDRSAVSALPEDRAPARVMRGVEQALERHMLMAARAVRAGRGAGERTGERGTGRDEASEAIPVSIVQPPRYTLGERVGDVLANRWFGRGVRLASAAALLGAVGVGVWLGSAWLQEGSGPAIASRQGEEDRAGDGSAGTALGANAFAVAAPEGAAPSLESALARAAGASDHEPGESAIGTGALGPAIEPEVTLARAVELAREGRLVVRVRTSDPLQGMDAASAIADRLARARGIHALERDVSLTMAAALERGSEAVVLARDDGSREFNASAGDGDRGTEARDGDRGTGWFGASEVSRFEGHAGVASVLLGELTAEERELARLVRVLEQRGSVWLEPAPAGVSAGPALDAGSVLWWSEPPERWTPRGRVLIVIESK